MTCSCGGACGVSPTPDPCGGCCSSCAGSEANRAGLPAVAFGEGDYAATLRRMRSRLSSAELPALRRLTARGTDVPMDPAIALLDAWACLSDVLNFYNERLVNEAYLRTCTERFSAVELARLVGYAPRPGVAADTYLAFTLDDLDKEAELVVPAGTRAYSQPGPGETMQPFETTEALTGRPRWSRMQPRLTQPQRLTEKTPEVYVAGLATGLTAGSVLMFSSGEDRFGRVVAKIEPIAAQNHTRITLQRKDGIALDSVASTPIDKAILGKLLAEPSLFVGGRDKIPLDPKQTFDKSSYAPLSLLGAAYPALAVNLADAVGGTTPTGPTGTTTVYSMTVKASLHGYNAPFRATTNDGKTTFAEWNFQGTRDTGNNEAADPTGPELSEFELALDAVYDQIKVGSQVAVVRPKAEVGDPDDETELVHLFSAESVHSVIKVETVTRTAFRFPAKVTKLTFAKAWREDEPDPDSFAAFRGTVVYAAAEPLELVELPDPQDVASGVKPFVLDGYFPGLEPGRRVIVAGERSDIAGVSGLRSAELVMIAGVSHRAAELGDAATNETIHTELTLAVPGLAHSYIRTSVTVFGNVAHGTHGESHAEVLGGGNATKPLQTFALKHLPLTYVSAPTPSGVASTLEVRVNDLRWREAPNAVAAAGDERCYLVRTDDGGATSAVAGFAAPLPTGADNVRAVYRSGIGVAGNVRPDQISVLASRPNGVTGVTNPIATTGGADRDDLARIRERTPLGLGALDRLLSASDFEDFARAFGGVGKARMSREAGGALVLTIAAEADAPISSQSALMRNLRSALVTYSGLVPVRTALETRTTPKVTVKTRVRKVRLLALRARIGVHPDYLWSALLPQIEDALFEAFGFDARDIGERADPGAAVAVIQDVPGVVFVDMQAFGAIDLGTNVQPREPAEIAESASKLLAKEPRGIPPIVKVAPDTIAYLSRAAAGTVVLSRIEELP